MQDQEIQAMQERQEKAEVEKRRKDIRETLRHIARTIESESLTTEQARQVHIALCDTVQIIREPQQQQPETQNQEKQADELTNTPQEIMHQIKENIREAIEELTDKSPNIIEIVNNVKTLKAEVIDICNETIAECTRMQRETAEQIQAEKERQEKITEVTQLLEQVERSHKADPGGLDARLDIFLATMRTHYAKDEGVITEADAIKINQEIEKSPVTQIMRDIGEIISTPKQQREKQEQTHEVKAIRELIAKNRELYDKNQIRQAFQKLNETANEIKEQPETPNPYTQDINTVKAEQANRPQPTGQAQSHGNSFTR